MSLHMAMSSAQATLARFDMYSECLPFTSTDALGTSGGLLVGGPASTGSTGWEADDDDRFAACSPRSTTSGSCYSSGSPFNDYCTSEEDLENIDLDSLQTIRSRTCTTTSSSTPQGALLQGYVSSRMEQFLRSSSTTPPPLSTTPPSSMMITADPAAHHVHTHRYPLTLTGSTYTHTGVNFRHHHQQQHPADSMDGDLRKISGGGGVKKASTGSGSSKPNKEVLRKRRLAANERERRRMNSLNVAFDHLRGVVPGLGGNQQLSKYDTLQMAQTYIRALQDILQKPLP